MNPAFLAARDIGNKLGAGIRESRDENAIESILSQASQSGDPQMLQDSIGKILSQVSPERQGVAIQYLQNAYSNVEKRRQEGLRAQAARQGGYDPYAPPQVQAAQVREGAKGKRLAQYGLGAQGGQPAQAQVTPEATQPSQGAPTDQAPASIFKRLTDDQLVVASGSPDREVSEPAKQELKLRKSAQTPFEPESEKLEAKRVSDLATEIENEYKGSQNEELRFSRMEVLDKEGNVSAPALIKFLDTFGFPIGILSNPATEEYRKLEADFVRDVSKVFPGGKITNYEIQSYMKTIPGLMNSPEGRKEIIRNRKLINEAKKVRYEEYRKILKENDGKKPRNLGILLEERTREKVDDIEKRFAEGIEKNIDKFQTPLRMYDPQGGAIDVPPKDIERALKAGARFG